MVRNVLKTTVAALVAGLVAANAAYIVEHGGTLSFPADADGYRIPDFSHAGYCNGDTALPEQGVQYEVKRTLADPSGDETARIQAAIDAVEAMAPNAYGFRGAVVLGAGTWNVTSLTINADGVVLRGAGMDRTVVQSTLTSGGEVLLAGGTVPTTYPTELFDEGKADGTWDITDAVVHAGAYSFSIEAGHGLQTGERIIIEHPCTQAWITAVDNGGAVEDDPWAVNAVPIRYYRYVTAVDGNMITVDAPVMYSLVRSLSQSFVFRYGRVPRQRIGVEGITFDADKNADTYGEGHPNNGIRMCRSENCWFRDVRVRNFKGAGMYVVESSRITFDGCEAVDPHGIIKATRRYNFSTRGGQLILYKDCYARKGRHNFIGNGHAMDNGNVYLRCTSDDNYAASESGHQRWDNGALWDNCLFVQTGTPETGASFDQKRLWIGNHGDNSTCHGWASVSCVAYKCSVEAPGYAIVAKPPTGMNYEIECTGTFQSLHSAHGDFPGALDIPTTGSMPQSLYEAQLAQRHGSTAISGVSADVTGLDFGFAVTDGTLELDVTLTNTGGTAASGTVSAGGTGFSIATGASYAVPADSGSCTVTVRFTPGAPGQFTGTIDFSGDFTASLPLTGLAADLHTALSFDATDGTLLGALGDSGTYVATGVKNDGMAVYAVTVPTAGEYEVAAVVGAPTAGANSFYAAFNRLPEGDTDAWDIISLTSGYETRYVSVRGSGAFNAPEFAPMVWTLDAGTNFLVIGARETGTRLRSLALEKVNAGISNSQFIVETPIVDGSLRSLGMLRTGKAFSNELSIYSLDGRLVGRQRGGKRVVWCTGSEHAGPCVYIAESRNGTAVTRSRVICY